MDGRRFIGLGALGYEYWLRLRAEAFRELLAGVGIAAAVALVFATLVANGSIASSAGSVLRTVIGPANLQLRARSGDGLDQRLLHNVKQLPGVRRAASILEQTATITGPGGRTVAVDLAGANPDLALLNGLAETLPAAASAPRGIGLSDETARALGVPRARAASSTVEVRVRGRRWRLPITVVLGHKAIGALSGARIGVLPLGELQRLAGLPGAVSRVLVQSKAGQEAHVRSELDAIAGPGVDVEPATQDEAVLRRALAPSSQASGLFAALSALLGLLFALCVFLSTVPERRAAIADKLDQGVRRSAIIESVAFQAVCLGLVSSVAGIIVGRILSAAVFAQSPGYLARAFTLGESTHVGVTPVLTSLAGGLLASSIASALPLLELLRGRRHDEAPDDYDARGNALGSKTQRRLAIIAALFIGVASVLLTLRSSAAIPACILVAVAGVLAVPGSFSAAIRAGTMLAERIDGLGMLTVALASLRATTVRSLALAATGAVALFGNIALGGSRNDLLRGIDGYTSHYVAAADLWVVNPGDNQAIDNFAPDHDQSVISTVPGVAAVHTFQGSFLDLGTRRMWVIAWPPGLRPTLLQGQLTAGSASTVNAQLEQGGSVTVSDQLAGERHLHVGDVLPLPTPSGDVSFRIAATTTNFGWTPGAIVMSTRDYTRAWKTSALSAIGINVDGRSLPAVRRAIIRALGPSSGLEVLSSSARAATIKTSAREGLSQLGDIAELLLGTAILAMIAAAASIIQHARVTVAAQRLDGLARRRIIGLLLAEVCLVLLAGAIPGTLAGIYGQRIIDTYLRHVTGFPVARFATSARPVEILLLVTATGFLSAILASWRVSRVPPRIALEH